MQDTSDMKREVMIYFVYVSVYEMKEERNRELESKE